MADTFLDLSRRGALSLKGAARTAALKLADFIDKQEPDDLLLQAALFTLVNDCVLANAMLLPLATTGLVVGTSEQKASAAVVVEGVEA